MADGSEARPRSEILADVAEMYFLQGKKQDEIAQVIGVTRSMISRMLTEAREQGIIEIKVNRPLYSSMSLTQSIQERFGLLDAHVVANPYPDDVRMRQYIGAAGAQVLRKYLRPGQVLGTPWGRTIRALIDALDVRDNMNVKVVQLCAALGAQSDEFDGYLQVRQLASKLGGEGYYLNAPLRVESREMAQALMETPGIQATLELTQHCNVVLLGIGGAGPDNTVYFRAGQASREELEQMARDGAVGNVCVRFYDQDGNRISTEFHERIIVAPLENILKTPVRIGLAGGLNKVDAILGALRGGFINVLVVDQLTAQEILDRA